MRISGQIPKQTNLHSQETKYPLLFHSNEVCTNARRYYVIRTVPVSLYSNWDSHDVACRSHHNTPLFLTSPVTGPRRTILVRQHKTHGPSLGLSWRRMYVNDSPGSTYQRIHPVTKSNKTGLKNVWHVIKLNLSGIYESHFLIYLLFSFEISDTCTLRHKSKKLLHGDVQYPSRQARQDWLRTTRWWFPTRRAGFGPETDYFTLFCRPTNAHYIYMYIKYSYMFRCWGLG